MNAFRQRHLIPLLHLSFWGVYLCFTVYTLSLHNSLWLSLVYTAVPFLFHIIIGYFNYFFLLPQFMRERKLLPYLLKLLIPLTLVVMLRMLVAKQVYGAYEPALSYDFTPARIVQLTMGTVFMLAFLSLIKFTTEWLVLEGKRKEMENQQMAAELKFLRAQINPHFLFNTLNNLYYLAYIKSDDAPEVIDRLSQMMRYMIYEANQNLVPLHRELTYMQHYIMLEKIRLSREVDIKFEVLGLVDETLVAPLIFMTFLENAFKHGVSPNGQDAWLHSILQVQRNECRYVLRNSKGSNVKNEFSGNSGVGLLNVRRRLELSYPDRYELTIADKPDHFEVNLFLKLG